MSVAVAKSGSRQVYSTLGSLTNSHWPVSGNNSFAGDGGWNGFRMAAVYSTAFAGGRGGRLYYHGGNATINWIQELVWHYANDSWSLGAMLFGAVPGCHLTVTIEPRTNILRLFYASGQSDVAERWLNITTKNASYQSGISVPELLAKPTSDMAAISTNDSTFLYYVAPPSSSANVTIRELTLSPQPNSAASTSTSLVAVPDLAAKDTGYSAFAPMSAVLSTSNGGAVITVMWADVVVGTKSGYGALRTVNRAANASWGDASYGKAEGLETIPLGDNNADPP